MEMIELFMDFMAEVRLKALNKLFLGLLLAWDFHFLCWRRFNYIIENVLIIIYKYFNVRLS